MSAFQARVYGLVLQCDEAIPGLSATDQGPADVVVRLRALPAWLEREDGSSRTIWTARAGDDRDTDDLVVRTWRDGAYVEVAYDDGTRFVMDRRGTQVWAQWRNASSIEDMATYLLGPVLGLLLRLRGTLSLHASAVTFGDTAVAFTGQAGAGKSTTAAAFAQRGARVIADDIAALFVRDARWWVEAGPASVRLWPESATALFGDASTLPLLAPSWEKRQVTPGVLPAAFAGESPVALSAVVILGARGTGSAPTLAPLSQRDALVALVADTYASVLLDPAQRGVEFVALSRLVQDVPVYRATPADDIGRLDELCDAVRRLVHG
jgi:hypothetical protein